MSYDLIVIGAGPGGYVCAIRAAQLGLKTALIEKFPRLGGTCLNVGCIPSKALLEASEWYHNARTKFPKFGVETGEVKLNLPAMMTHRETTVRTLTDGIGLLMKKNKVAVIQGDAELLGSGKVRVGSDELDATSVVLALGSVPIELPFLKFDGEYVVSSTEALAFDRVPEHLIVIGAGAVGLELGSVWRRLGAKVTVVEMLPNIVPFADKQLATMLQRSLTEQGIEFRLEAKVTGATIKAGKVELAYTDKAGAEQVVVGDKVLSAVGRRAFTESAGIAKAVVVVERGKVVVDDHFQTNLPGVYAIGDLIRGPMLAHKASEEGVAVAEMLAGHTGHVNYNAIPNVVYTDPELAAVGLTEEEAKTQGFEVKSGKFFFRGNGRALSMASPEGFIKVVADAATDRCLGVHILGPHASELIAEATLALEFSASAEDIGRTIHAHPTLAEALKEAALAVNKMQIHG